MGTVTHFGPALENYRKRKEANRGKQVDNNLLPAGSPIHYYYCKWCGEPTEILPELHHAVPKTVCDACSPLAALGFLPEKG